MTIRPMNAATAARLLQQRSTRALSLGEAYDVFAQMHGYKNWAHYAKVHPRLAAKAPSPAGKLFEQVQTWPLWCATFDCDEYTGEYILSFFPYGSTLESRWTGRRYPEFDTSGLMELNVELAGGQSLSDLLVLEAVHALVPRIERYGVPSFAHDREVGNWAHDELGWGYLATQDGQAKVDVTAMDTGDDSAERVFMQLRAHPSAHAQFMAQTNDLSQDAWRYLTLDQCAGLQPWFTPSDSACVGKVFEALNTAVPAHGPSAQACDLLGRVGLARLLRPEHSAISAADLLAKMCDALGLEQALEQD